MSAHALARARPRRRRRIPLLLWVLAVELLCELAMIACAVALWRGRLLLSSIAVLGVLGWGANAQMTHRMLRRLGRAWSQGRRIRPVRVSDIFLMAVEMWILLVALATLALA